MSAAPSPDPESSQSILCYYSNSSSQIQVALILHSETRLEQVLFPGQRWMFWSPPGAVLDIYTSQAGQPVHLEQIPCAQLQVLEQTTPALA